MKQTQKIIEKVYITNVACCECPCGEKVVIGEMNKKWSKDLICEKIRFEKCQCGNLFIRELKW